MQSFVPRPGLASVSKTTWKPRGQVLNQLTFVDPGAWLGAKHDRETRYRQLCQGHYFVDVFHVLFGLFSRKGRTNEARNCYLQKRELLASTRVATSMQILIKSSSKLEGGFNLIDDQLSTLSWPSERESMSLFKGGKLNS